MSIVQYNTKLKTSNDNAKAKFYRAFNSVMGKIGRCASNEVTVSLIKVKCLPILLYGTEACHFSVRETTSLEYPISCALLKVFNTKSSDILENCKLALNGLDPVGILVYSLSRDES